MKRKLILGVGLVIAGLLPAWVRAQQSASTASQGAEPNVKMCVEVSGAVRVPTRFGLRRRIRLYDALAAAGGLTERAGATLRIFKSGVNCFTGDSTEISKNGQANVQPSVYQTANIRGGDLKENPYLEDGDSVMVPRRDSIFVTGAVLNPREIYIEEPLTLTQALALAGGLHPQARTTSVEIYRQKKTSESVSITVDLEAIRLHRVKDPILQPYDMIGVPSLGPRKFGPPSYLKFDTRPLIPPGYRVIY